MTHEFMHKEEYRIVTIIRIAKDLIICLLHLTVR